MRKAGQYRLTLAVIISSFALCAPVQTQSRPFAQTANSRLLRFCRTMFQEEATDNKRQAKEARRFFEKMNPQQRARQLAALRKSLYRGTRSYTSVAYVLAYYGTEVEENVGRMLYGWLPPASTPQAVLENEEEGYVFLDGLGDAVIRVYKRHPSDTILALVLGAKSDGAAGDDKDNTIAQFFAMSPHRMLRTALRLNRGHDGIAELASALAYAGNGPQDNNHVRRLLHTLKVGDDSDMVHASEECLRKFEKTLKRL